MMSARNSVTARSNGGIKTNFMTSLEHRQGVFQHETKMMTSLEDKLSESSLNEKEESGISMEGIPKIVTPGEHDSQILDEDILHHGEENEVEDLNDEIINDDELDMNNSLNNNNNGTMETSQVTRHDFFVSFLVDARGGILHGCRHSGIKVFLPPKTVPQPMRITCRYIKKDAILYPPPLNEGEGLACRIIQVGPRGTKFLGSVMIEVPHVASLRDGEREVVILRCDSSSKGKWTEHKQEDEIDEKILKDLMDENLSSTASSTNSTSTSSPVPRPPYSLNQDGSRSCSRAGPSPTSRNFTSPGPLNSPQHSSQERPQQFVRILATEFPQYFAVVTRNKQDVKQIGPEGGVLCSSRTTKAQVHIRPKSLIKSVNVGLSVTPVEDSCAEEIIEQGGSVSPFMTIEPRRRKFHRAITLTMPLPERARELLRRQRRNDDDRRLHRSKSPSVRKTVTSEGVTVGPIGSISKPSSILPPDPVEEALSPNKKTKKKSHHNIAQDQDEFSKIQMSLRLVCSMSANFAKACWEDVTESTPMTITVDEEDNLLVQADITNNYNHEHPHGNGLAHNERGCVPRSEEGCAQFTSIVSASFLLVHCPNWMSCDLTSLVDQVHKNVMKVPYFARFHFYVRRNNQQLHLRGLSPSNVTPNSPATTPSNGKLMPQTNHLRPSIPTAHVRVLCISEPDRAVNPLELQEDFVEICRSDYVELYERGEIHVKFGGNVAQTCKDTLSGHLSEDCDGNCMEFDYGKGKRGIIFQPFSDNRQGYAVKRKIDKNPFAKGTIAIVNTADGKTLYEEKIDLTNFIK